MENLYDNTKFEKIWQKIVSDGEIMQNSHAAKNGGDSEKRLKEFMDDEASNAKYYSQLSKKCGDRAIKEKFNIIAGEKAYHLKKLQIAYFIMCGDSYTPVTTKPYITSVLDALRLRYISEVNGEKAYQAAAMEENDGKLSQLYSELALSCGKHGREVEKLIEKIIC